MTGYGIGEYIRNRRLYQTAVDLKETDDKVIDIASRYGYETPESFTKAFSRFHGATPSQVRGGAAINTLLPLTIKQKIPWSLMTSRDLVRVHDSNRRSSL